MFGTPENNNTESRSDSTSGDVSEVESGLEVTESEMDDDLSKELDGSFDSFILNKKITSFDKEQRSDVSSQQQEPLEQLETEQEKDYNGDEETDSITKERSFVDKAKDTVFGKESAYDAERFEKAGIKGAFDELPRCRREAVYETFENAPDEIKNTVNAYSSELSVENTTGNDCCHYDLDAKKIRMEANMDNGEYAEVFSHEYGHFVDNKKGDVSDTYEFREAMSKDLANYDRSTESGRQNFDKLMDDLMSSDAAFDRAVSDNMSAYFKNDPEVVRRYFDEGIDYYQHDNSYWSGYGNREAEIYANSFSMAAQDNKASCEFMQQHFPNTWEQFKKTL